MTKDVWIPIKCKKGDILTTNTPLDLKIYQMQGNGSLYFKVANAVQNLELLDAGEVLEAVNNVVPDNSRLISGYSMPTDVFHYFAIGASGARYTMPYNGWLHVFGTVTTANGYIYMDNKTASYNWILYAPLTNYQIYYCIPVSKDDIVEIGVGGGNIQEIRLNRAKGDSF